MHINLYLVPFVILLGWLMGSNDTARKRKWYIIICSIVLVFVAAMRSPEWMTYTYNIDTLKYKDRFENVLFMDWNELWHSAVLRYTVAGDDFDVGFTLLLKFFSLITSDFYIYSLLADLLFFIPFGIILYRYCNSMKQLIFAFVFYIALVQSFLISGARQMFALGFDMIALLSVMDKKRIRAIIFFLIGVTLHFSSFLFTIPLLMIWYGVKPRMLKILHIACFLVIPVVLMMTNQIIIFMGNAVGMDKYAAYGEGSAMGGAITFILLIELLSLFCLVAIKKKDIATNLTLKNFYVMAPLFTFFAPLIYSNGSMMRISIYYHIFLVLLVPYALDCMFQKHNRTFAYVAAITILAFLCMKSDMVYYFYWQR